MIEVAVIRDSISKEIHDILDPESERQEGGYNACGGWNGYCGGCDVCLLMQAQHAIEQGVLIEIVWVPKDNLDQYLKELELTIDDNLWIKEGF